MWRKCGGRRPGIYGWWINAIIASHRLAAGIEEPACVRNCVGRARIFGDLNNGESAIFKLKVSVKTEDWHPEYGTKPMTPCIAPDKEVFSAADGRLNG